MTFQKECERVMTEAVAGQLKAFGFRRTGTLFRLPTADGVAMVWVQRSRDHVGDAYKCALNMGAYSDLALIPEAGERKPSKVDFGLAQIRWRLGEVQGDRWWLIRDREELAAASRDVADLLIRDIDRLLSISTASGMLRFFEGGQSGGQSALGRERTMNALRKNLSSVGAAS